MIQKKRLRQIARSEMKEGQIARINRIRRELMDVEKRLLLLEMEQRKAKKKRFSNPALWNRIYARIGIKEDKRQALLNDLNKLQADKVCPARLPRQRRIEDF